MGEYPIKFGKYMQQNYPQIPCLVLYNGIYGVRFWNCTEECWDDEECDDFFCEKEAVEKWIYIDTLESFQQEQPVTDCHDLDSEIFAWQKAHANEDTAQVIAMTARHFYELGLNARK